MLGRTFRAWAIAAALAVVLCLAFLGASQLMRYLSRHYYYANRVSVGFDYAGGRVRVQKHFLGVKLAETIDETHLTAVYRELIGEPPPPVWRLAYSWPYVRRFVGATVEGRYGGAVARARDEDWWPRIQDGLSPDAFEPALQQYLALLADADTGGADPDDWCLKLSMVVVMLKGLGKPPLGVEDLSVSRMDEQFESLDWEREKKRAATASPEDDTSRVRLPGGREVDARTGEGWEALQWAVQNGRQMIVNDLLAKGVDYDRPDGQGDTALHLAVLHGQPGALLVLQLKGADINAVNHAGSSPLHMAATDGDPSILRVLLNLGADTGVRDARGRTALHIAAATGRAEAAEFLVASGADKAARDNEGRTPLDLARSSKAAGAKKVAKLLARSGPPR